MSDYNLILVESPGKIKTIKGYLGENWVVKASMGHVRDLPLKAIGIDLDTMTPDYVLTERGSEVIKGLKPLAAKAKKVYLATDLDREGEAISWHLQQLLKLKEDQYHRVSFSEITKSAIEKALSNPTSINMKMVRAQEGRRLLDRIVGYVVSPALSKLQFSGKVSAGRVQSIALKFVVERQLEISKHNAFEYFEIHSQFNKWTAIFDGTLNFESKNDEPFRLTDKIMIIKLTEALKSYPHLIVANVEKKKLSRNAPSPFTTSLLQQAASVHLQFSPSHTMSVAQKLYENGLITYMRTDSTHLSAESIASIRDWIKGFIESKGDSYHDLLPAVPNMFKSSESAQEAHEAIRPSNIKNLGNSLEGDEKLLYQLIWKRTVASQCSQSLASQTKLTLHSQKIKINNGQPVSFVAVGETPIFGGWKLISGDDKSVEADDADKSKSQPIPDVSVGDVLTPYGFTTESKKTRPPKRYTEASLVKALEASGVGRPATYAAMLNHVIQKGYIKLESRMLEPTKLGFELYDVLNKANFSFFDYSYTKNIEGELDKIASGQCDCIPLLQHEHKTILNEISSLEQFPKAVKAIKKTNSVNCKICGSPLKGINSKTKGKLYRCESCDYWVASTSSGAVDLNKLPTLSKSNCTKCKTTTLLILSGKSGDYCKCMSCKGTFTAIY